MAIELQETSDKIISIIADKLHVDINVELVIGKISVDDLGNEIISYKFKASGGS